METSFKREKQITFRNFLILAAGKYRTVYVYFIEFCLLRNLFILDISTAKKYQQLVSI